MDGWESILYTSGSYVTESFTWNEELIFIRTIKYTSCDQWKPNKPISTRQSWPNHNCRCWVQGFISPSNIKKNNDILLFLSKYILYMVLCSHIKCFTSSWFWIFLFLQIFKIKHCTIANLYYFDHRKFCELILLSKLAK